MSFASSCGDLGSQSGGVRRVGPSFDERVRGVLGGLRETIERLARRVGGHPSSSQITLATNGGSNELSGASELGMRAMLLSDPNLRDTDRFDDEIDWNGERIGSLSELLVT